MRALFIIQRQLHNLQYTGVSQVGREFSKPTKSSSGRLVNWLSQHGNLPSQLTLHDAVVHNPALSGWPQMWKTWNTQGFLWTQNTQGIIREFCAASGKTFLFVRFNIIKLSCGRPAWWAVGFSGSPLPCLFTVFTLLYFVYCAVTNKCDWLIQIFV